MSLQLFVDAALLVGVKHRRARCTGLQALSPCDQRKQAAISGSSHGRPLLGSCKLPPRWVLLQQALCGMVAIATPLSLGADLGDGRYLGLMELRAEDAKAFAEQLRPCGEITLACDGSILGWSVGQPPTSSERRFRDRPRELLPATLSEGAWVPKQLRRVAAAAKKLVTESCADRLVVGLAVRRDAESKRASRRAASERTCLAND